MDGDLEWLPEAAVWGGVGWAEGLAEARRLDAAEALPRYRALAGANLDLAQTVKLDRAIRAHFPEHFSEQAQAAGLTPVRLALLGSSTVAHLLPGIRVAGLRRGLAIETYETPYGTYRQELAGAGDVRTPLGRFSPTALLLALDARHVVELEVGAREREGAAGAVATMEMCWRQAREAFGCAVLQQAVLPVLAPLMGNQEHRLEDSPAAIVERVNAELRASADAAGVQVLAVDRVVRELGLGRWHDAGLWFRAKQEVHPAVSPLYGDHVARVLGALMGQSAKCLVLDLDHTLWGGGIGDDGLEGIALGSGSAAGEAHVALQRYALALKGRGVVLAVCSKNDEANALAPFEQHPEMLLRRSDIACFVANWEDKATNLRRIARQLNVGLDALVFVDDNPAERGLVRRELPMVHVPEMPADPADYVRVLAAAGYFEATEVTAEDRSRAALYAAKALHDADRAAAAGNGGGTDLASYLASLRMELEWAPFGAGGQARIVQLINKTNQFNLTTRRVTADDVARLAGTADTITLQLRLKDVYGDHGVVAVVVAERASLDWPGRAEPSTEGEADLLITHWLMSCRVLGREVELATMNLLVEQARARGVRRLIGHYIPTAKNGMVRDLYPRLGFGAVESVPGEVTNAALPTWWALELADAPQHATHIVVHATEAARV